MMTHLQTHANTLELSNKIHWHARCWHEAASLRSHWLYCSWQRGSFLQPSPWMLSWPSRPRCALGCWASLEPQRTPPARRNQTAGKQWARCRWPWRRTPWEALKPGRCTQMTERALRGFLKKRGRTSNLVSQVFLSFSQWKINFSFSITSCHSILSCVIFFLYCNYMAHSFHLF